MEKVVNQRNGVILLLIVASLLPLVISSSYVLQVMTLAFIWAICVYGYNMTVGYIGYLSLAHIGFFAVGACGNPACIRRLVHDHPHVPIHAQNFCAKNILGALDREVGQAENFLGVFDALIAIDEVGRPPTGLLSFHGILLVYDISLIVYPHFCIIGGLSASRSRRSSTTGGLPGGDYRP